MKIIQSYFTKHFQQSDDRTEEERETFGTMILYLKEMVKDLSDLDNQEKKLFIEHNGNSYNLFFKLEKFAQSDLYQITIPQWSQNKDENPDSYILVLCQAVDENSLMLLHCFSDWQSDITAHWFMANEHKVFERPLADQNCLFIPIIPYKGKRIAEEKLLDKFRILIAEDEHGERVLTQIAFEEIIPDTRRKTGKEPIVEFVEDGEQAWNFLNGPKVWQEDQVEGVLPDMIISDFRMPNVNGEMLVRWIKEDENMKDIPTYIFSSYAPDKTASQLVSVPINGRIKKGENISERAEQLQDAILEAYSHNPKFVSKNDPKEKLG